MLDYFAYGSNLDFSALRAKGVAPLHSTPAVLRGWRIRFNVAHFFRHEGGVANIEPTRDGADRVLGIVHRLEQDALAALDAAELYPDGYDRTTVVVETDGGPREALTYIGTAAFVDDSCLPSRRYLTIVVRGAELAGLDPGYVERLRSHPVLPPRADPPFEPPPGEHRVFTRRELADHPTCTALDGAVFDMAGARPEHRLVVGSFGGRDMTAYHLRLLETSDGTDENVPTERTPGQQAHLNTLLWSYAEEYRYVGRLVAGG